MKGTIRIILCISLVYGGIKTYIHSLQNPESNVYVEDDAYLSHYARTTIKLKVQELLKKALPLQEIGYLLHQAFPQLAHVQVVKRPGQCIVVYAHSSKPIALCNGSFVLCENNNFAQQTFFNHTKLRSLASYTIADAVVSNYHEREKFKQFVMACSSDVHKNYMIAWHNEHEIYLQDRERSHSLCIDAHSLQDLPRILLAYQDVRSSLEIESKKNKKKTQLAWDIDARFKNQMIAHCRRS